MAKAEKLNIPLLTEDEFLQLIKTQSSDEKSKSHQSESANKSKNKKTPAKKVSSEVQNGKKEKKITPVKMAEPEQNCSKSQKTVELKLKKEILQEDEPKCINYYFFIFITFCTFIIIFSK